MRRTHREPEGAKVFEVPGNSQLRHVPGDAFGQRVKVLVAAAHHRLQASALAGTLGPGHAAGLLLSWERKERKTGMRRGEERRNRPEKEEAAFRSRKHQSGIILPGDDEAFGQ